jgi:hypothetical protein
MCGESGDEDRELHNKMELNDPCQQNCRTVNITGNKPQDSNDQSVLLQAPNPLGKPIQEPPDLHPVAR